jgi:hypothetical protein
MSRRTSRLQYSIMRAQQNHARQDEEQLLDQNEANLLEAATSPEEVDSADLDETPISESESLTSSELSDTDSDLSASESSDREDLEESLHDATGKEIYRSYIFKFPYFRDYNMHFRFYCMFSIE